MLSVVWLEFLIGPQVLVDSFVAVSVTSCCFPGMGLLTPRPTHNLEDQVLLFVYPLPCNLPGLVSPGRSLSPHLYSSQGH